MTSEHGIETILHPKLKKFDCCYDEKENAHSALKFEFDKYQSGVSMSSVCLLNPNQSMSSPSSNTGTVTITLNSKNFLTQCSDTIAGTNAKAQNPYQEIDDYLNSDVSSDDNNSYYVDGDIDVLSYWKQKRRQFPGLSSIAKQIYAIPASNTIIERLFSAAKNTVSDKRINLGSEKLNQLLFIQKNYTSLKRLFHENKRKRAISMSSTTTASSEDPSCIMPKQSRFDDEDNYSASDDFEIFFD